MEKPANSERISLKEDKPVKKKKPGKKGKKKGKSKSKKKTKSKSGKSSKSKKSKGKVKTPKPEEELNSSYSAIEVQNPISYVHIDYDLFPKKFKYGVDVICWGPVAKIYTKQGIKCLKTVIRGDIAWVPVFLEHYLNPLTTEEIRKLLTQNITVNINIGINNVGAKVKKDKTSVFYLHNDDANNVYFPEVLAQKPKVDHEIVKEVIERILKKLLTFPIKREMVTWIYKMDAVHSHKIAKIVTKRWCGEEIYCKDFYEDEQSKPKEKKKKKGGSKKGSKSGSKKSSKKKSSKMSSKKSGKSGENKKMNFKIPAHVLVSDPVLATYQVKETETKLEEAYILLSSENMLTVQQKTEMCPLVVKIRKINNLPHEVLKENGFLQIFSVCDIPGIAQFRTSLRQVGNTPVFDESRFIITNDFPNIKVLEILETRRVTIKIIGVKEGTKQEPDETGKKKKSKKQEKKSKKSKSSKSSKKSKAASTKSPADLELPGFELSPLAIAAFDVSSLATNFFLYKEKGQCYNFESIQTEKSPQVDDCFLDRFTTNELHLSYLIGRKNIRSPLKDAKLFLDGTTLKFEAHFLSPAHPRFYIKDASQTYKRLLLIVFKEDVAKVLISTVMMHNHQHLGPGPLLVPNFLVQKRTMASSSALGGGFSRMLSGFFLDDGNCFIIYMEGPSNGYILNLILKVSAFNYSTGKVFYNSDHQFEDRLYTTFHKYSGFFILTLKLPLAEIFAQEKIYIVGNTPLCTMKTIQKLNLILNATTFKSILNHDLLPTEIELFSFSIEYGIQIRFYNKMFYTSRSQVRFPSSNTNFYAGPSFLTK